MNKLTEDLNIIQNLPDQPTLSARELKAKFDEAVGIIKEYLNSVVEPAVTTIEGDYSTSEEFTKYKQEIKDITDAFQETIDGLDEQISNAVGLATQYVDFYISTHSYNFNLNGPFADSSAEKEIRQANYYPLSIAGFSNSQTKHSSVQAVQLKNRKNGVATISYLIHNTDDESKTGTLTVNVLWVKIK